MKKLVLVFMLTSSMFANSFFQEEDKQMHIVATSAIGFTANAIAYKEYGLTAEQSFWVGVAAALTVGLAKELYDSRSGGTGFDSRDMLADGIGGVIGSGGMYVIYRW